MGTHISFVRSASMDGFYPGQLVGMITGGNAKVMAELKKFGITAKRKSDAGNKVDFSGVQMKKLYQKMLKDTDTKCGEFGIQMYQLGGFGSDPVIPGQATQANFCKPEVEKQGSTPTVSGASEPVASTAAPAQMSFDAPVEKKGPSVVIKKNTNVPKFSAAAATKAPMGKPKIVAGGLDDDFDDWFNELDNVEAKKKEDDAKAAAAAKAAAVEEKCLNDFGLKFDRFDFILKLFCNCITGKASRCSSGRSREASCASAGCIGSTRFVRVKFFK